MKYMTRGALVLAAVALLACGREEAPRAIETTPAQATPGAAADSTAHAGHAAGAVDSTAAHDGHAAPSHDAAAAQQHGGHATPARQHGAHPPAAPGHAQHTEVAAAHPPHRDTAHAQHADTTQKQHVDTAHAQHADTTHRQHVDTAHAAHDMRADSAAHQHAATQEQHPGHGAAHAMPMLDLGGGFMIVAMAQAFPTFTFAMPNTDGTPLAKTGLYLTQPAIMANVESRGSRVVLRTTLNFEGVTQRDGELTFGGWGEGYLDKRHPHTLLHEFMLSANFFRGANAFSLSFGKGFAPYGTDDPMSRPVVKYPTNHHLSQALERWTLNGVAQLGQWSVEGGIFGGAEPTSPYDFSNIESFADSWSARVTRRFGPEDMGAWPWELSLSHAYIEEQHHEEIAVTRLYNAAIRHERNHERGRMYALVEASRSDPNHGEGYFSILAEGSLAIGRHKPYARVEYATRPEYERLGAPGTDGFFRYHHDDEAIGATRWLTLTGGYGFTAVGERTSLRPYVEAQFNRVRAERGDIQPEALFGRRQFWSVSFGTRIFVGGEAMRMGTYGVLDPMTRMHKPMMVTATQQHH